MGKGLQKLFKAVLNEISQVLQILGESVSKASYLIPDPRNFDEATRLSDSLNKPQLKSTKKQIKNIINNHNFLVQEPIKGEPVTPCMDVYKSKIQYDGSLDKIKVRIMVRGDMQNKELVGNNWSPTASMRILK